MHGSNWLSEGGPVIWIILFCGAMALAVFAERLFHLRRAHIQYRDFLKGVFNNLDRDHVNEAVMICEETPGPVASLLRTAILNRHEPRETIGEALDHVGRAEISRLERRLVVLATLAQVTPLLGLLGTFLGLIETVLTLREQAPLVQSADITDGLLRALIASAAGLMVAIPCYGMFNLLVVRIDRIVLDMEQASSEILAFVTARLSPNPGGAPHGPTDRPLGRLAS
jgi:biopolymer transport protein ExbB